MVLRAVVSWRMRTGREAVQLISRLSCAVNLPDALVGKVSARARVSRGPAHGPMRESAGPWARPASARAVPSPSFASPSTTTRRSHLSSTPTSSHRPASCIVDLTLSVCVGRPTTAPFDPDRYVAFRFIVACDRSLSPVAPPVTTALHRRRYQRPSSPASNTSIARPAVACRSLLGLPRTVIVSRVAAGLRPRSPVSPERRALIYPPFPD